MPTKKSKFVYEGPITSFGKLIANRWYGETWATSENKALSNLSYQYKTQSNLIPGSKIELSDDYIREVSTYE